MQTMIHVLCTPGTSLRERIAKDARRMARDHGLVVSLEKRPRRSPGWMKVHSERHFGALNVEWHATTRTLIARVVTRGRRRPHDIVGDFVAYLLRRHRRRVQSVVIADR